MKVFKCKQCSLENEKCLNRKICKKCHSFNSACIQKKSVKTQEYINSKEYKLMQTKSRLKYENKLTKQTLNINSKKRALKSRDNLTDSYIKQQFKKQGFLNVSNELIEVKRIIIKTKRLCKI